VWPAAASDGAPHLADRGETCVREGGAKGTEQLARKQVGLVGAPALHGVEGEQRPGAELLGALGPEALEGGNAAVVDRVDQRLETLDPLAPQRRHLLGAETGDPEQVADPLRHPLPQIGEQRQQAVVVERLTQLSGQAGPDAADLGEPAGQIEGREIALEPLDLTGGVLEGAGAEPVLPQHLEQVGGLLQLGGQHLLIDNLFHGGSLTPRATRS
jgi:hypothetical protein